MVGRYCSLVQLMVVCSLVELLVSSRLDTFEAGEKFRNVRAQPWYVFVFAVLIQNKKKKTDRPRRNVRAQPWYVFAGQIQ